MPRRPRSTQLVATAARRRLESRRRDHPQLRGREIVADQFNARSASPSPRIRRRRVHRRERRRGGREVEEEIGGLLTAAGACSKTSAKPIWNEASPFRVSIHDTRIFWEGLMERRNFLQLLCVGMGMASAAAPAKAFTLLAPIAVPGSDPRLAPEPSVATGEDIDHAQIEKVWYGHWRRVNRRHYRRVGRRVYRRHYW